MAGRKSCATLPGDHFGLGRGDQGGEICQLLLPEVRRQPRAGQLVAAGQKLKDLGLQQESLTKRGYAIQARVTTEDPTEDFRPDTGRLQVWRPAEGFGIRLDGGNAYPGATISPHYDSMLMKVTASSLSFQQAADKLSRALTETRIRGVKTNTPFIQNVLKHPDFLSGQATTAFIEDRHEIGRASCRERV